jgi:Ca2+-binding RTX toxin-like protein
MAVTTTYSLTTTVGEFTANSYVDGNEFGSSVVSLTDGGFATSYGWSTGGNVGPLVNRDTNGDGIIDGGFTIPYAVPNADVDMLGDPDMTRLANGNLAVVWDSATQGGGDIRGAIINATTGAVVHADFEVSSFASDTDPQVAGLTGGNWVAVFNDTSNVWAQLMSATGVKIGGQINLGTADDDLDANVTALNDGGFAVTWVVDNGLFSPASVFVGVRNADGSQRLAATNIAPGIFGSNENTQPAIASLQNGGFAVVYKDSGWADDGLSLHIFNAAGGQQAGPIRIDVDSVKIEQNPDITVLSNGMIVVTWTHPFGPGDDDIRGRLFTEAGAPVQVSGSDFFTITGATGDQTHSSLATLLEGRFVTTWTDSRAETGGSGTSIRGEVNQLTEVLTSDAGSDTMTGTALYSRLLGNGGDDTMLGGGGVDSLFGGDGNDTITSDGDGGRYQGDGGDDMMESGDGGETMLGGTGNDTIDHSWFNGNYNFDMASGATQFGGESYTEFETALMGGGSDNVSGTVGADTVFGGAGNDQLLGLDGDDALSGGTGRDSAVGGAGNDLITGAAGNDRATGGDDADTLLMGGGRDKAFGDAGDDTVNGGSGRDRLEGGAGNDDIVGSGGADKILGDGGDDVMIGGGAGDNMDGGAGNDTLFGNAGLDRMFGGFGADVFRGGSGGDTMDGGGGADVFVFGNGSGRDRVLSFEDGIDRVDLEGITFGDVTLSSFAGGVRVTLDVGDRVELTGVTLAQITAADFI